MNVSLFQAATHLLRVNCTDITGDRPRQPAYEISALNIDFNGITDLLLIITIISPPGTTVPGGLTSSADELSGGTNIDYVEVERP